MVVSSCRKFGNNLHMESTMKHQTTAVAVAAVLVALGVARGQDPSAPASAAMAKLQKVMGQQSMSATMVMTMSGTRGPAKMNAIESKFFMNKGKIRMEMDYAKLIGEAGGRGGAMPAGLDKMVNITRPDKKVVYMIVPGLNAYVETAIPDLAGSKAEDVKIQRKGEGSEKIEKFSCDKVRNTITAPDGTTTIVMTWEAKDLGGLVVKSEVATPEGTMTMIFKDIKRDTPAASLFEPPAGATRYNSMQEMMMASMMKMMQGQ